LQYYLHPFWFKIAHFVLAQNIIFSNQIMCSKSSKWSTYCMYVCFSLVYVLKELVHSGAEILKKSRPKKNSWNQINQFHEKFFWPNSIFCNFKNGQKSIFELGKSLKPPKMQHHEKKILIILFYEFFTWTFLNFMAYCVVLPERFLNDMTYKTTQVGFLKCLQLNEITLQK